MVLRRRLTALALGLLLSVLLLCLLLYRGIRPTFAVPRLEQELSSLLERPVRLQRAPFLQVRKTVVLRVDDLAIADPLRDAPVLRLHSLALELQSAALLRGEIVVHSLTVDGLELNSHVDGGGQSNLPTLDGSGDDRSGDLAAPLRLRQARLSNITLRHRDARHGRDIVLRVDELRKADDGERRLRLYGRGTLQRQDWDLRFDARSPDPLIAGRAVDARLTLRLADLRLQGTARSGALATLAQAVVDARLAGSLPPEIAELSPLLDADSPLAMRARIEDGEPGMAIDLSVDFPRLALKLAGTVADPLNGDGADLLLSLRAPSINDLAAAAGLGETDPLPFRLRGRLLRDGGKLTLRDLRLAAGAHQAAGALVLPAFPGHRDATLDLNVAGPDFSFLQRLLRGTGSLPRAYRGQVKLQKRGHGPELLDSSLRIGDHQLTLSGPLGAWPAFRNSDLALRMTGPRLAALSESVGQRLPEGVDTSYALQGRVAVDDERTLRLHGLDLRAGTLMARIDGSLRGHPHYDRLQLTVNLRAPSLARSSRALGLRALGDLPAMARFHVEGSPQALTFTPDRLSAGGVELRHVAGGLARKRGRWQSDLTLDLRLEDLPALLGDYAGDARWDLPLQLRLKTGLADGLLTLAVEDIRGAGLRGEATVQIADSLRIDGDSRLRAELALTEAGRLLAGIPGYTAPPRPLSLRAETRVTGAQIVMDAALRSAGRPLLEATLRQGRGDDAATRISLRGSGDDFHRFGRFLRLPEGPLPYRLMADGVRRNGAWAVRIGELALGDSRGRADLRLSRDLRELSGEVEIARARLQRWLTGDGGSAAAAEDEAKTGKPARLIPALPVPLEFLDQYRLDLSVRSGDLGVADPQFAERSLLERLSAHWVSGDGRASLTLEELVGSRGRGAGAVTATRDGDGARIALDLRLDALPIGVLAPGDSADRLPRHELQIALSARGANTRELAASVDGTVLLRGGEGQIDDSNMRFATHSFLEQLLLTLLPVGERKGGVDVECTVLALRADQGVLYLDPGFATRTGRVDLSARGTIDLQSERLRLRFDNQARRGLGISAASLVNPYVQVSGTLARPTLGLNVAGSTLAGGAAVASGGLTVLAKPLLGRLLGRKNPCEVALARWESGAGE